MLPASEKKSKNLAETFHEMLPFLLYAAVPIIVTITIACVFGQAE